MITDGMTNTCIGVSTHLKRCCKHWLFLNRYGDYVAVTWGGQIATIATVTLAAAFYAISPGIIGTSFALKYQESKKQKRKVFKRPIPFNVTSLSSILRENGLQHRIFVYIIA